MDRLIEKLRRDLSAGRISRRQFTSGAIAAGAGIAAASMLADRALANTPKKGGRFRLGIGHGSASDSLDPASYSSGYTLCLANTFCNQLSEIAPDGSLSPSLAESFEPDAEARVWRCNLRQGVEFHNGKSLTAEDVITSFQHHIGEDSTSGAKGLLSQIASFEADGDNTVVFTLENGNADFPFLVSEYRVVIMPSVDGKLDWQSGVGTGPYRLEKFDPGVSATFTRNPNYWKEGRAHFDEVELISILDATARQNAVMTGAVDAIDSVELKTAQMLNRSDAIRLLEVPGTLHYTFPMDSTQAPYGNADLAMALKYATDRQAMLEKVLFGHGIVGNDHPISPANRFFAKDLPQREQDLDKAKFHFDKSGLGVTALDLSVSETGFPGSETAALILQEACAKFGLTINVVREPNDGYWSEVSLVKPFYASYWGGRPTEDWMFEIAYAADANWNQSRWKNERFNDLLLAARVELDDSKRRVMYEEMQALVRDDCPTIIPLFANHVMALTDKVQHGPDVAGNWQLDGGKATERWWFA
jgi:peptide/nickel transport system substrate-binding protein